MLTEPQKAAIHAHMLTVPELAAAIAAGDDPVIKDYYNAIASPDYYVWRTSIPPEEYLEAMVWTELDTVSEGKRWEFDAMTGKQTRPLNAAKPNIRQGLTDVFNGSPGTRNALVVLAKRKARLAEKLLATGTGTLASPATMGWEGPMTYTDASDARAWGG